ncbi:PREDICTED: F-box protein At5g07610-like [Nelumbo nucifera]|uniref:F-box protein At5g07610-like n=1 Tax=Nelumbo nucifera TaxID=4432 RepID=A0A1U8ALA0_NELNU|nr:PREDICTED: F-box protein At5g07610-like [Nelumbo nucifera]
MLGANKEADLEDEELEQTSSSAAIVADSDDLITNIFLHLPIKSLLRIKSVCKRWLSLISDPFFVNLRNRTTNVVSALFFKRVHSSELYFVFLDRNNSNDDIPIRDLSFVEDSVGLEVTHSCNGLICCRSRRRCTDYFYFTYYICNPTTKQYRKLPPTLGGGVVHSFVNIAFDPCKSPHYKAICISSNDGWHWQIEIYYSEIKQWRQICGEPFTSLGMNFDRGVLWNGAMHWISTEGSSLSFDVERECFRRMPSMPLISIDREYRNRMYLYIGESQGHLYLIGTDFDRPLDEPQTTCFHIFEMETDYSGWVLKYQVDSDVPIAPIHLDICFSILHLVRGEGDEEEEEEEDLSLVIHTVGDHEVFSYNLKDIALRKLRIVPEPIQNSRPLKFWWSSTYQYIESICYV